jgi:hypothetical protein
MQWNSIYIPDDNIIATTVHGTVTLGRIADLTMSLLNLSNNVECNKYLIDYRGATQNIAMMEIYSLPDTLKKLGMPLSDKAALIYSVNADDTFRAKIKYFEDRCCDEILNIRVFTDYDKGYGWLQSAKN